MTVGILRVACEAKLMVCTKQPTCKSTNRLPARSMLATLSVTIADSFLFYSYSFIASVSKSAILLPVCLACIAVVRRTFNTNSHSLEIKWEAIVTHESVALEVQHHT